MFALQIAPKQRKTASVIETTQKQFVRQVQSIQVLEVSTSSFLWFCIVISSRSPATLPEVWSLISVLDRNQAVSFCAISHLTVSPDDTHRQTLYVDL